MREFSERGKTQRVYRYIQINDLVYYSKLIKAFPGTIVDRKNNERLLRGVFFAKVRPSK